ncbi:phosphatase PAP2 family protein [Isoptericola sp. 4D.3]|uniref:Phosphatase PAP2 family protein n=1 Tax=Isoptericola peretonis TaxID=2918523 RepID=A0ABT0J861_9MICO|nr:phosphatase PAP2 family protein [Isoptericola sp. 4D.3]
MTPPALRDPAPGGRDERVVRRAAILVLAGCVVLAASTFLVREPLYRTVAGAVTASPLAPLVELTAEAGLLVLVATAAGVAVRSWLRARRSFWVLVAGGVGVVAAYLTSEVVKLLVAEQRPCHVIDVATVLPCPPVGDWSWPSNHATLAAAFAVACLLAAPRTTPYVAALAVVVAGSRVAAGVHYVHDVLSGLVLGATAVVLAVVLLRPVVRRLPRSLTQEPAAHRSY